MSAIAGINPPSSSFEFPTIGLKAATMEQLTQSLIDAHVKYGLGAKASPLSLKAGEFSRIDCSGFVRWTFFHGANITIPDGSANQHQWFDKHAFKKSDFESALLTDGILRIAFLAPQDSIEHIGHVLFIHNKLCYESHGSTGPDNRRVWGSKVWMTSMHVYVVNNSA